MIRRAGILFLFVLFVILFAAGCGGNDEFKLEPLEGDIPDLADQFFTHLVNKDFKSAYSFFSLEMRDKISERALNRSWRELLLQVGFFNEVVEAHIQRVEGHDVVLITTAFEKDKMNIIIIFDKDNRVNGLLFEPVEEEE